MITYVLRSQDHTDVTNSIPLGRQLSSVSGTPPLICRVVLNNMARLQRITLHPSSNLGSIGSANEAVVLGHRPVFDLRGAPEREKEISFQWNTTS